jgi:hypothetical protein
MCTAVLNMFLLANPAKQRMSYIKYVGMRKKWKFLYVLQCNALTFLGAEC